jgi:hypothetical protein
MICPDLNRKKSTSSWGLKVYTSESDRASASGPLIQMTDQIMGYPKGAPKMPLQGRTK